MIADRFENMGLYSPIYRNLEKAIAFLSSTDFASWECGRKEIDADKLACIVVDRVLEKAPEFWESHRKYIDVHYVLSGEEEIWYTPCTDLKKLRDYEDGDDSELFKGEAGRSSSLKLQKGDVMVFFPGEIHMTNGPCGGKESVRKVILKVMAE